MTNKQMIEEVLGPDSSWYYQIKTAPRYAVSHLYRTMLESHISSLEKQIKHEQEQLGRVKDMLKEVN